jgi:hypothetical protein
VPSETGLAEIVRGALGEDYLCSLARIWPELDDHRQALSRVAAVARICAPWCSSLRSVIWILLWGYLSTGVLRKIIVIFPIRAGAQERVRRLVAEELPFAPSDPGLERLRVFVTDAELVLFFEGAEASLARVLVDPSVAAAAWRQYVAGSPRVAKDAYSWARVETRDGLSFEPTPGPGDSEGGDVYPP